MTYCYQYYLSFNENDDKKNQETRFKTVNLSAETLQKLTELKKEVHWLIMAEPFCPDCVAFVPVLEKMRQANPLITLHYVPRHKLEDESLFFTPNLHQLAKDTHSIPSLYDVKKEKMLFSEFPEGLKKKITEIEDMKEAYRQGNYQMEIEKTLLALLLD